MGPFGKLVSGLVDKLIK